jgi:hypothetical protein
MMNRCKYAFSPMVRISVFAFVCYAATVTSAGAQLRATAQPVAAIDGIERSVTQGRAKTVIPNLFRCTEKVSNHRISAVGAITSTDGKVWTVPAETVFQTGTKGADLFNECNRVAPKNSKEVSDANVPVVVIDPDGEIVTGYIVVDNYFELYVNGKLIAVDAIPFTPFNSTIVKFRVKKPYTYALKLVDWEENLGLGTEMGTYGGNFHQGDGGFIARFSDGTVTDSSWKAQSFYIAPLTSPDVVVEKAGLHFTPTLGRIHPGAPKPPCEDRCYAVHYPLPKNWASPNFDDSKWPRAFEYTDQDVGVTSLRAYTHFPDLFKGARWIWSFNLVFDNLVIARKTVR